MKKNLLLIPIALGGCLLSSCQTESKLIELERRSDIVEPVSLSYDELNEKFTSQDDFALYIHQSGCLSCAAFEPILNSYIGETHAVIYSITTQELNQGDLISFKYTPTFALIKKGKIVSKVDSTSKGKELETSASFRSYLDKYTYLSTALRISEAELDGLISGTSRFIIAYTWDSCGDCQSLESLFLKEFREKNPSYQYYEFELSYYFSERENSEDPLWTDMTKRYLLSREGSEELGYKNGVVPTFQLWDNGKLLDAAVIFNDTLEATVESGGDTTAVKVVSSYFTEAPFVGKTFKASGKESAYSAYKNSTVGFYGNKLSELFAKL